MLFGGARGETLGTRSTRDGGIAAECTSTTSRSTSRRSSRRSSSPSRRARARASARAKRFEIAPSRQTEIFDCQLATHVSRAHHSAPPRSRMGVRTALAAPLQASPFIIASIFALVRALLKERSWKLQERVVKDLAGAIPVVAPGTRVCIYGLSANPPTGEGGHATIVSHLRRMFDEVWVLPVYTHAFESKHNNLAPYEHRKAMCELAFGIAHLTAKQRRNEKVKVLDVERAVVRAIRRAFFGCLEIVSSTRTAVVDADVLAEPRARAALDVINRMLSIAARHHALVAHDCDEEDVVAIAVYHRESQTFAMPDLERVVAHDWPAARALATARDSVFEISLRDDALA